MVNAELTLFQKNAERRFFGTPTFDSSTGVLINSSKQPTFAYKDVIQKLMGECKTDEQETKDLIARRPTFLTTEANSENNKVMYTSYSRSGNTFLRKYLEQLTGINTGSDGDLNYNLHHSL